MSPSYVLNIVLQQVLERDTNKTRSLSLKSENWVKKYTRYTNIINNVIASYDPTLQEHINLPGLVWENSPRSDIYLVMMLLLFSHSVVSDSCDPMDCRPPSSSDHGIFQAEYWSVLPFPSPGDLSNPGIEAMPLTSPALAGGFFTSSATWKPHSYER